MGKLYCFLLIQLFMRLGVCTIFFFLTNIHGLQVLLDPSLFLLTPNSLPIPL